MATTPATATTPAWASVAVAALVPGRGRSGPVVVATPAMAPAFRLVRGRGLRAKDGSGDPILDFPREILSLGDEDGGELISTEIDLVGKLSPSGMVGTGTVHRSPTPIPANPPREAGTRRLGRQAHVKGPISRGVYNAPSNPNSSIPIRPLPSSSRRAARGLGLSASRTLALACSPPAAVACRSLCYLFPAGNKQQRRGAQAQPLATMLHADPRTTE